MSRRAHIRWPVYATTWALIALADGIAHHDHLIVALAAVAVICFWGVWILEDKP